jgi:hypothetical protein
MSCVSFHKFERLVVDANVKNDKPEIGYRFSV